MDLLKVSYQNIKGREDKERESGWTKRKEIGIKIITIKENISCHCVCCHPCFCIIYIILTSLFKKGMDSLKVLYQNIRGRR